MRRDDVLPHAAVRSAWLARERSIAGPNYNRWLAIACALAIHLCIGTAYGFSVFLEPLSRAVGISAPIVCPLGGSIWQALIRTSCDWQIGQIGWVFSFFFLVLGGSAALLGGWVEQVGPRKAGIVAALCWSGGHVLAALGVWRHELWVVLLGYGGVGGVGLGLGYVLPISTLMRWFPDRRGLAGGLAVMGFGGGAMIGAPLAALLMDHFRGPDSVGAWQTMLVLAALNLAAMSAGALAYRQPPPGWQASMKVQPTAPQPRGSIDQTSALRMRQFWLLWLVLGLNTSVGMGVLGWAALMLQDLFGGRLLGLGSTTMETLNPVQRIQLGTIAASFTGLLSVFNVAGRLWWPWLSDRWGRKPVFSLVLALGIVLYAVAPAVARSGNVTLFVALLCVAITSFGGGFALVPGYIADLFGPGYVSAIQGRVLTAWSVAAVAGPVLVGALRDADRHQAAYGSALHGLAALLMVALAANLSIRAIPARCFGLDLWPAPPSPAQRHLPPRRALDAGLVVAWVGVGLPMAWGLWMTLGRLLPLLAAGRSQ